MEDMELDFTVRRHKETDLIIAVCKQKPGILVHGRALSQIEERLPIAIRAVLEAEGHTVGSIQDLEGTLSSPDDFMPSHARYSAAVSTVR